MGDKKETVAKIKSLIEELRPTLQRDGGDIEFAGLVRNVLKIKLKDKCSKCPMRFETVQKIIFPHILKFVPTVKDIEIVES